MRWTDLLDASLSRLDAGASYLRANQRVLLALLRLERRDYARARDYAEAALTIADADFPEDRLRALAVQLRGIARIGVTRDGADWVVGVEDNGPGLPADVERRLFEPLFTTRSRGTGLGLALCRRITEKHGGTIAAGNRPEGGARFVVTLPRDGANPS